MKQTDIDFFKEELAPLLESFNLEYRTYAGGDLGNLEQVVFDTLKLGGNFDFWENGWLGVFVYDYVTDSIMFNNMFDAKEQHKNELKDVVDMILSRNIN
ncbi:hypothetical protein [Bacteroides clarus]|uniref:hypothetical protein n=1 Tax=Bacteroides clarus TaxID=626929 RepID=UPI0024B0B5B3|nr:hypothetical protein [Bacteroides clarus]